MTMLTNNDIRALFDHSMASFLLHRRRVTVQLPTSVEKNYHKIDLCFKLRDFIKCKATNA